MADLLPGLSSDDEVEPPKEEEDDQDSDNEIDDSFEFGGILGEDGGIGSFQTGWSYQTALDQVKEEDKSAPRLDIASLISAKRKKFSAASRPSNPKDDDVVEEKDEPTQPSDDEDDQGEKAKDGDEESSSSEDESESDDSESVEGDKKDTQKELGEDVLKTRSGKKEKEEEKEEKESESDEDSESGEKEEKEEAAKAKAYFDDEAMDQPDIEVFPQLTLSRPLLRGIAAMGFVKPTPIQAAVIPLALQGRDICASAVTGSGKTAAFLLPILERLLHRYLGRTKAIILTPTRELAAQCVGMLTTLAQFTKIRATLIVGGNKNVNAQAAELRTQPEIIVATPGRLLDHITNSAGVTLEDVEFLVLDEADRLLDLGFQDEVHELIQACPVQRQTLLFSATMNTKVDDLIKISLKKPVRVRVSDKSESGNNIEVAPRLEQEFVRVRPANEGVNREAMLLALLTRTFTKQVIVFFDMKTTAHRMMIVCGLNGIKCTELHGNLTQQQRLTALEDFRAGAVDVLLATDLAARGLDIDRVAAVINFEMPNQIETYVHRIGRTARAGRGGYSCTLVGEGRRHLMKDLIKDAESKLKRNNKNNEPMKVNKNDTTSTRFETGVIRSRTIPPAVTAHFAAKIEEMESHVDEILQAEIVAKIDRLAEMEATRAENIIEHSKEIHARPKKEWFASNKQKETLKTAAAEKQKMIEEKVGTGMHRMTRKKRRAREALEGLNAPPSEGGEDDDGEEKQARLNIKAAARAKKREKEKKNKDMSVHDIETARLERKRKTKGQNAAGDSSLFDDERIAHSSKKPKTESKSAEVAQSSYSFRGFDPNKKISKNRKKGVKAFKSKSKHNRRK